MMAQYLRPRKLHQGPHRPNSYVLKEYVNFYRQRPILLHQVLMELAIKLYAFGIQLTRLVLYTNKLYSKILHPVTDEVTMIQTCNTRSYTLSRSSNTRSYIILRASNTQSYITLRASNTQGYIILRTSNTRSYTCHGRVTYEVTNFHRRITHDHTRVTQQVHRYYY
jgi:hypothetical protein